MTSFSPTLRASAAACLLLAGTSSLAASTATVDEMVASLQSAYVRSVTPGEQADVYRELFATVFTRVQRSHATEVDPSALAAAAIKVMEPIAPGSGDPAEVFKNAVNAALRTLDSYSRYIDMRAYSNERGDSSGKFGGLGLEIEPGEGAVRVIAPVPGSPAARAGLQPGDLIVRVDDQPLLGISVSEASSRMRGEPGTPVTVTIRRTGVDQEFTLSLTRETIRRQPLSWSMEGNVLVLRLKTFSTSVAAALDEAIAEATAANAPEAIVLDMRGNPGGLLREAVTIADTFLREGDIVSLRGRTASNQRMWKADANELLAGVPMVVLIDRRSASASELVAAALQENGRAKVMGQRSYGKGTVQSTYSLGDERGALKLTTSFYLGPSGRSVQETGVTPDIELVSSRNDDSARGEVARTPETPKADAPQMPAARVEQERCSSQRRAPDPALSCAVTYLLAPNNFISAFARDASAGERP